MQANDAKNKEFRQGLNTAIALGVLTLVEYGVALIPMFWPVLVALALVKAGIVLQSFMHLPRLFSPEGEGGH